MNIPPDVEYRVTECWWRLNPEEVPEKIIDKMPECIRVEGCFCNLDGIVKKKGEKKC